MDKKRLLSSGASILLASACTSLPKEPTGSESSQLKVTGKHHCEGVAPEGANSCGAYDHKCGGFAADSYLEKEWVYTDSAEDCANIQKAMQDPQMRKFVLKVATNARKYARHYKKTRDSQK